jgi:hypothetical protein
MSKNLVVGPPRSQYLVQKCSFKNESLLGLVGFVLVGYMGGATFLGLLASAMGMCH